jgi:hypothetical protein
LTITNASFDDAENVALMFWAENDKIKIYDKRCGETTAYAYETYGIYRKFIIPHIGA